MHRTTNKEKIERLTRASEEARLMLEERVDTFRHQIDVPRRLRHSLKAHPMSWLGGSAVFGLITSRLLLRRGPKSAPRSRRGRGVVFTLLGLAFTAIRPLAQVWLTGQLKQYLADQLRYRSTSRP